MEPAACGCKTSCDRFHHRRFAGWVAFYDQIGHERFHLDSHHLDSALKIVEGDEARHSHGEADNGRIESLSNPAGDGNRIGANGRKNPDQARQGAEQVQEGERCQ